MNKHLSRLALGTVFCLPPVAAVAILLLSASKDISYNWQGCQQVRCLSHLALWDVKVILRFFPWTHATDDVQHFLRNCCQVNATEHIQTTIHYLSQSWAGSISTYGVTGPQWVNDIYMYQSKQLFFNRGQTPVHLLHKTIQFLMSWYKMPMFWCDFCVEEL